MIYSIAACDNKFGIGKDGQIPWHNSEDFKYFKAHTENAVVVMGSTTWKSLPKKLPNRKTVVLSSKFFEGPDLILNIKSPQECIDVIQANYPNLDIWVCGGPGIYSFFADEIDQFHLTRIDGDFDCDATLDTTMFWDMTLSKHIDLPTTKGVDIWMK